MQPALSLDQVRSFVTVAEERHFKDYRTDITLDLRQMRVALRRMRRLTRSGDATSSPGRAGTTR